jgi:hypothetical protein
MELVVKDGRAEGPPQATGLPHTRAMELVVKYAK